MRERDASGQDDTLQPTMLKELISANELLLNGPRKYQMRCGGPRSGGCQRTPLCAKSCGTNDVPSKRMKARATASSAASVPPIAPIDSAENAQGLSDFPLCAGSAGADGSIGIVMVVVFAAPIPSVQSPTVIVLLPADTI